MIHWQFYIIFPTKTNFDIPARAPFLCSFVAGRQCSTALLLPSSPALVSLIVSELEYDIAIALRELHTPTSQELSSSIFQSLSVSLWVRDRFHPTKSPLFSMPYTDPVPSRLTSILTILYYWLYWLSTTKYQPSIAVLNWPGTQLRHLVTHSWATWV